MCGDWSLAWVQTQHNTESHSLVGRWRTAGVMSDSTEGEWTGVDWRWVGVTLLQLGVMSVPDDADVTSLFFF